MFKGACLRCGRCCRSFNRVIGNIKPSLEDIRVFQMRGIELKQVNGIWWAFDNNAPCEHLIFIGKDKCECAIYEDRPEVCKSYPKGWPNDSLKDGCGFKFER